MPGGREAGSRVTQWHLQLCERGQNGRCHRAPDLSGQDRGWDLSQDDSSTVWEAVTPASLLSALPLLGRQPEPSWMWKRAAEGNSASPFFNGE